MAQSKQETFRKWYDKHGKEYRQKNKARLRESDRRWRERNPDWWPSYYEANADVAKARARQWCIDNPERAKETAGRWKRENPEAAKAATEAWAEANPEKVRAAKAKWAGANREKRRLAAERRRLKLLGSNSAGVSEEEWARICDEFSDGETVWCAYCHRPAEQMDHVKPVFHGGLHDPSNVVPACSTCNASKGSKVLLWQWIGHKIKSAHLEVAP